MNTWEETRERRRGWFRRNLIWLVPVGAFFGIGMFIGLGFLTSWLWRVTLGDIFGVKPISFWQAWGLILLSQILFKAHVQRSMRPAPGRHWGRGGGMRGGHADDSAGGGTADAGAER
jgi:hypothetical protein